MIAIIERMTEDARRIVLFARNEAGRLGGKSITPEHLLLGLLQADPALIEGLLSPGDSVQAICEEVEQRSDWGEKVRRSLDIPITDAARNVMTHMSREADRLSRHEICTEHLLLGLLREEESLASKILRSHGLELPTVREKIFEASAHPVPSPGTERMGGTLLQSTRPVVPNEEAARQIAEAVWSPFFGGEEVERQQPLQAELRNMNFAAEADLSTAESQGWLQPPLSGLYWIVHGTVPEEEATKQLRLLISQRTARIVYIHPPLS